MSASSALTTLDALSGPPYTPERTTQAIAVCEGLLRASPGDVNLHAVMGSLLSRFERWAEALPHLATAVAAAPSHPVLQSLTGLAYFHQRQFEKAAVHLGARLKPAAPGALMLDVSNVEDAAYYGAALMHLGQFDKAAPIFDAVIKERVRFHKTRPPVDVPRHPAVATRPRRVHPILYLPVEVKARELPSKALLATAAAAAGFTVVVAATWNLLGHNGVNLPPGIILFKTMNYLDASNMQSVKAAGHLAAALDEESFGRSADEVTLRLNVHPDALAAVDLVMLQGRAQEDLVRRIFPDAAGKLHVTGSLRADLLTHLRQDGSASPEPEGYLLICLMSGNVNCSGRSFAVCAETTLGLGGFALSSPLGQSYTALFQHSTAFELSIMPQMAELIRQTAAAFPERRIVVRPHPVEDAILWRKVVDGLSNVVLRADGPLTDWLGAAAAMVYVSGCGAGFEAFMANVPAVRFEGNGEVPVPQSGISSALNAPARTCTEAVELLHRMLSDAAPQRTAAEVEAIAASLHRGENTCAEDVTSILAKLHADHAIDGAADLAKPALPLATLRDFAARRKGKFVPQDFHLRKFPKTEVGELQRLLDRSRLILGLDRTFAATEIDTNTFLVES